MDACAHTATVDGNEAAARIAYLTSEVVAIYPITPASPMGELADAWAATGQPNLWGNIPHIIEMQSEGGAAGALHGALQAGALSTTFTASQGLLLMLPNMFKIAGELTAAVIHVAARSVATHALSIFGDHSDVMAARGTGFAMLASGSPQEAQDLACVAHAATLESRVPFLHFFDGFRTSHEITRVTRLGEDDVRAMMNAEHIGAHRGRALSPDRPVLRGTAQNPDVFFQAREACNPYYDATPAIVQSAMDRLRERTGRAYRLFDYIGAPDAERVLVLMGSAVGACREAIEELVRRGEKVGVIIVRLYRPFDVRALLQALPETTRGIVAMDRTKEPGSAGEPLYQDVVTALVDGWSDANPGRDMPRVVGARYGLSSKELTPAMAKALLDELRSSTGRRRVTMGIVDDVTHLSVEWDEGFDTESDATTRALFYGLGSDGTVGANKNTVKIIGEGTPLHVQGYFVYDSRKAGAVTVSHLRIGPDPIHATYLIRRANFVACHQFHFLERMDVLEAAEHGAIFLLNSPYSADDVWERIPIETQRQIIERKLRFYVVDAAGVADAAGLGNRINTVMQTCFFDLSPVLPSEEAIARIKGAIEKTYSKRGEAVVAQNFAAVDGAVAGMQRVAVPGEASGPLERVPMLSGAAPEFVTRFTAEILAGHGDRLPVSRMPVDGTFPVGTARYEKRSIAHEIPIWDPGLCTDCALCPLVCPHAAIRMKVVDDAALERAPATLQSKPTKAGPDGGRLIIQVAPDDCTGCGVCVDVCPARSKEIEGHKAIDMLYKLDHLERERVNFEAFEGLPEADRTRLARDKIKGCQLMEPLFEFSGACGGCGETPYLKLLTQLFGDRMVVANATGCSSIYGANLPTTPWSKNADGRGPAWSNSLFEDNAEFGLGMRLALDQQRSQARLLLERLSESVGPDLAREILDAPQTDEAEIAAQRGRLDRLRQRLGDLATPDSTSLLTVVDALVERSLWIIGGDGWAYDIGFGGLDHVLASGANVNILVMDTEVYSNTGGQASKATPRGAVAKFASQGKPTVKKDLGMLAMAYGSVYVAQIAIGANPRQTLRSLLEAEAYPGVSLVIAYSTCIAHGIDMTRSMAHMKGAVKSGFWPLYRFTPQLHEIGRPFSLDSRKPSMPYEEFAMQESRFSQLFRSHPETAERLMRMAQRDIDERWRYYEQLEDLERLVPHDDHD